MTTSNPVDIVSLTESDPESPPETLTLTVSASPQINFACQQNAVAILHSLEIENDTTQDYRNLALTMTASPGFLTSKTWRIDHLRANDALHIEDRDVQLDATYLLNLTEMQRGTIAFLLSNQDGEVLAEHTEHVEILARNEWGGYGSSPEILAAFSMPNDPVIDKMLRSCSDVLRKSGHDGVLKNYTDSEANRIWLQASAAWAAVSQLRLDYAYPPSSFEKTGQKIRTPEAILESKRATCIDTTLLFTAMFEQMHLKPIIIIEEGHAYVGIWLKSDGFPRGYTEDPEALRKRVQLRELLVFETTLVCQGVSFKTAIKHATDKILKDDTQFVGVLDIARARDERIRPLSYVQQSSRLNASAVATGKDGDLDFITSLELPDSSELPEMMDFSVLTTGPGGRIEQWQRRLLDLTLRNPLLNLRTRKTTIPLIVPKPGLLEDKLADGKTFTLESKPGQGQRDAKIHAQQRGEDLDEQIALKALDRNRIYVDLDEDTLASNLTELYRKARNDLEEGGANTLFLVIGFLRWKRKPTDDKSFRAPLIIIPLELARQSVSSGFRISIGDDEPRFNTTLLEMLRQDFELNIEGLDGPLAEDQLGTDIDLILNKVRVSVKHVPGFEVVSDVAVSTLSFAKYLMWKDLMDRSDQLKNNPVVRHLIESHNRSYSENIEFTDPSDLDNVMSPGTMFTPLSADSSQLASVVSSANGKSFVMIGPPGTGKSQTISNMIAHNLALGRTVLFVSEKAAALDVVYRRLREQGLGNFCLELHSNKAKKLEIIQQLSQAWDTRAEFNEQSWRDATRKLENHRDKLNDLVKALHKVYDNGLTIRRALAIAVAGADVVNLNLSWYDAEDHSDDFISQLKDVGNRLEDNLKVVGDVTTHPLKSIYSDDWSMGWQKSILQQSSILSDKAETLLGAISNLQQHIKLENITYGEQTRALANLVRALQASAGKDVGFAFNSDANSIITAMQSAAALIDDIRQELPKLSVKYNRDKILSVDVESIASQYALATVSWWPKKWFAIRAACNRMKVEGGTVENPDMEQDFETIRRLQAIFRQIQELSPLLEASGGWKGIDSDPDTLRDRAECATVLRAKTASMSEDTEGLISMRQSIKTLVTEASDLLLPDTILGSQLQKYLDADGEFAEALQSYSDLADRDEEDLIEEAGSLEGLVRYGVTVAASKNQLNAWCGWRRAVHAAYNLQLDPVIDAIENGLDTTHSIANIIEVNYVNWWIRQTLDTVPALMTFVSVEHERKIDRFRELDEEVRAITSKYIISKIREGVATRENVTRSSEYGIIRREMEKKRRHKPLRQLISEAPNAIPSLTPCLLMSPLSIAQYLPADQQLFDIVIFDEASQITVWDAIGAIARGKQVVVVGDPKQLPPTNFFASGQTDEEEISDDEDLESILDEMLGANIPSLNLSWHYRSRNESLITFSNHKYYGNDLVTFPSPETKDTAVRMEFVGGIYDRGKSMTNRAEAEAIVAEIERRLADKELSKYTIGVVTFNQKQQTLILDLLDAARRKNSNMERFFSTDLIEPVFVKNLESVQGDERDVIFFSTTFGPDETGRIMMNFGPLNKSGGERRLNVAVTRARSELVVYSSLKADDINLSRTGAIGVRDLKHFLDFADRGHRALIEANAGSIGEFESPFESAVARDLQRLGWTVQPQIGVSQFRIDLGVVHPDFPGRYLAGVECDGATYHSAATARDRDMIRESVLRGLGWEIVRLWSTDYWLDPKDAIRVIDGKLREILESSKERAH